jgi:hypothetical protein
MIAAKTFFARMNEGRAAAWLSDEQLIKACEEFFQSNEYRGLERNVAFAGSHNFVSPLIGSNELETIATIMRSRIDRFDMSFFGLLESILFDIIDNHEKATLMLVTDSLSYPYMMKTEEIGVALENLLGEGMYLLFVNGRSAHAIFDEFKQLSMPVPVPG